MREEMKIIRYRDGAGAVYYGVAAPDGTYHRAEGELFAGERAGTTSAPAAPTALKATDEPADVRTWLAPVSPPMIWCIGQNYRAHSRELGMPIPEFPVVFAKGPNTVTGHGSAILLPRAARSDEVDYEAELVVVIGNRCKNVVRERALECVLGYTCGNDVSAREWQLRTGGGQWCRGKTFDTFAPMGPCLVTADEISDPSRLRIAAQVNGKTMQDSNTSDMIFDVPSLIEFLTKSMTLEPGTAIFTGTPPGVGMARKPPLWLRPGDSVSISIETIGTLTNTVAEEPL